MPHHLLTACLSLHRWWMEPGECVLHACVDCPPLMIMMNWNHTITTHMQQHPSKWFGVKRGMSGLQTVGFRPRPTASCQSCMDTYKLHCPLMKHNILPTRPCGMFTHQHVLPPCHALLCRWLPIISANASATTTVTTGGTFDACVQSCSGTANCEFLTYDYVASSCTLRAAPTQVYVG